VEGRSFVVTLLKFPQSKDGGMMDIRFTDPSFSLSSDDRTPVVMKFDSGTIDEYSIWKDVDASEPDKSFRIKITTYLLKNVISVMSKASSLTVTAESKSTSFSLPGFGDAITMMRQCADDYAGQF